MHCSNLDLAIERGNSVPQKIISICPIRSLFTDVFPSFTGGSAAAAGSLVKQLGGELIGYLFILEIPFLNGRSKLDNVPTVTLLETNE